MDDVPVSLPEARSNRWIWIIIAAVLLCIMVFCCSILCIAAVFSVQAVRSEEATAPEPKASTTLQTPTPYVGNPVSLDYKADPLFGSVGLQRGFTPDPYTIPALGGGKINTSDSGLGCGFTTPAPTFTFNLSGGASQGFLRLYFMTSGGADTTLLIRTPDREWLCADDFTDGKGMDPVLDMEFAPSGEYSVWVGSWESNANVAGSLYITQSKNNAP